MDTNNATKAVYKKLDQTTKKELCELWKKSPGISRKEFCRQQGLSDATFYRWCRKFFPKTKSSHEKLKNKKANWIPINLPQQNNKPSEISKIITLELLFPNNLKATINVEINEIVDLIKELSNANTIIR